MPRAGPAHATSQPAVPLVPIISSTPSAQAPFASRVALAEEAVNPILLQVSPIAVPVPRPERIEVHHLLTIIVREDKESKTDAKTESKKDWKVDSAFEQWFRLDTRDRLVSQDFPNGAPGVKFDFKNDYKGDGKVDRKDSLITRITAEVIDVKPNGNLVLEAKKRIKMDDEEQIVTLTGVCRSKDVTAQNTILSTQIADVEITAEHTGAARDATRRGWLMRLFDLLRPI